MGRDCEGNEVSPSRGRRTTREEKMLLSLGARERTDDSAQKPRRMGREDLLGRLHINAAVLAARDHRFDLVQINSRTEPPTIVVVVVVIVIIMQYLVSDPSPSKHRAGDSLDIDTVFVNRPSRYRFACFYLSGSTPGNNAWSFPSKWLRRLRELRDGIRTWTAYETVAR